MNMVQVVPVLLPGTCTSYNTASKRYYIIQKTLTTMAQAIDLMFRRHGIHGTKNTK